MEEVVMRAAFKKMMDERDKAEAERDAARADCATLHKMLDETVSERDAALRNYQNARIVYEVVIDERDVARAEADALRKEHDEIIEELDTYGWWMDNPNMLERLKFALATSQEKSDDLANMQLATHSIRQGK